MSSVYDQAMQTTTAMNHPHHAVTSTAVSEGGGEGVPNPRGTGTRAVLPPCRVCGGKASGYHYGVNSCQGCRMFYRRCLQRDSPPECSRDGACVITASSVRTACTACRFNKCLSAGMVQTSKRTGRYTHALRTTYYQEVQEMELRKQVKLEDPILLSDKERDLELEGVIMGLSGIFLNYKQNQPDVLATVDVRAAKHREEERLKAQLFGEMRPVPREEYMEIYKKTGVDIDGRRSWVTRMFPAIERDAVKYIEFAKAIPGFHHLPHCDQAAVIKGAVCESDLMICYHLTNAEATALFPIEDESFNFTLQDLTMFHEEQHIQIFRECILVLQALDFTPEEHAVLYAYLILISDAEVSPEGRRILIPMQDTMADVFYRLLQRNHDDIGMYFSRVISALLLIKDAVHVWRKEYIQLVETYSDLDWPPLIRNFYT